MRLTGDAVFAKGRSDWSLEEVTSSEAVNLGDHDIDSESKCQPVVMAELIAPQNKLELTE